MVSIFLRGVLTLTSWLYKAAGTQCPVMVQSSETASETKDGAGGGADVEAIPSRAQVR